MMNKKIILFILSILCLSLLCACSDEQKELEKIQPEMFEMDSSGEVFLSEEYQSYVTSVQSQLNKKYNSEFIYQSATVENLERKYYFVTFIEKDTNVVVNCECVRNNIKKENYRISRLSYEYKEAFREKIIYADYMEGFNVDYAKANSYVYVDFEIRGEVENFEEDLLANSKHKKILKVNIDPRYIKDFTCDNATFKKTENNLKKFGTKEIPMANNFEVIENYLGCGSVHLYRDNQTNTVSINKVE